MHLAQQRTCTGRTLGQRTAHGGLLRAFHRRAIRTHAYVSQSHSPAARDTSTTVGAPTSTSASTDVAAGASGCPFFRVLEHPPPPPTLFQSGTATARALWSVVQFLASKGRDPLAGQTQALAGQPIAKGTFVGTPATMVGTPLLSKEVLSSNERFSAALPRRKKIFGKDSVLCVTGQAHAKLRGLMSHAFSPDEIEKFTPQVQVLAVKHLDGLVARSVAAGGDVALGPRATKFNGMFTLEIICRMVAGLDISDAELEELGEEFAAFINNMFTPIMVDLPFLPFGKCMAAKRKLHARIDAWIAAARQRVAAGAAPSGVLDTLVAHRDAQGQQLTNDQLRDNMLTFLFAGYDSTAATITVMLYLLHTHPHTLPPLAQEQAAMVQHHGGQITSKSLRAMKAADWFVKETLRLKSVVSVIPRVVASNMEVTSAAGTSERILLKEGELLVVPLRYLTATDPQWAGRGGDLAPGVFNPSRWGEKGAGSSRAQIPFGSGPHQCLGMALAMMEARVLLAVLVRGYELVQVAEPAEWRYTPFLQPDNYLPVLLRHKRAAAAAGLCGVCGGEGWGCCPGQG